MLLAKLGIEAKVTAVRNPPDLVCTVERDGRRWRITYNVQTGATTTRPLDDPSRRLSSRRFLTGMHLAFTYPSRLDARWFWAVAVDAMVVSMVFWGFSGLLMWWQMKKLRWSGAATLLVSARLRRRWRSPCTTSWRPGLDRRPEKPARSKSALRAFVHRLSRADPPRWP